MDDLEQKLNSVLENPEMMSKILSMAQSLGGKEQPVSQEPGLDPGMLKQMAGLARQSGVDKQQQALLRALDPYLSDQRLHKLENAMRAAKMAKVAISALGIRGGKISPGR